jgi:hypothetical protein
MAYLLKEIVKHAVTAAGEGLQWTADYTQIIEVEDRVVPVVDGGGPWTGLEAPIVQSIMTIDHVNGLAGIEGRRLGLSNEIGGCLVVSQGTTRRVGLGKRLYLSAQSLLLSG